MRPGLVRPRDAAPSNALATDSAHNEGGEDPTLTDLNQEQGLEDDGIDGDYTPTTSRQNSSTGQPAVSFIL